jgi:hypothetical protein
MTFGFVRFVSLRSSSFINFSSLFSTVSDDEQPIGNGDRIHDKEQISNCERTDHEQDIKTNRKKA